MKRLIIAAVPLFLAGLAHAGKPATTPGAPGPVPANTPVTLEALLNPLSKASSGVTNIRAQMLTDAGKTVGFRGGMVARAQVLADALTARSAQLDTIFLFSPLINKNGTIPPVIVEARDVASFSVEQIRTATRVYKIEKEERFVSVPPTWRDYLFVGLPVKGSVDLPTFEARPQDGKEGAIWKGAVTAGWKEGEIQADAILAANFNRLTRDYSGMLMYSTLLQQGMVSTTRVAESQQTVSSDGKVLILGDKLRRVTKKATFEPDANKWRPTVGRAKQPAPNAEPATGAAPVEPKSKARREGGAKK
jgi:defect-in-organelle-trafficking protein DotC